MKKLFTFIVGAAVSLGAYAQDFDSGGLYYTVLSPDDKTCAVTGHGELSEVLKIPELVSYDGEDYAVTEIYGSAFWNCNELREVIISNSVKEIGSYCFAYSYSLNRLELGSSLETLRYGAFEYCPLNVVEVAGESPAQCEGGYSAVFTSNPLVAVNENLVAAYQAAWEGANVVPNIQAESLAFEPDNYNVQPGGSVQLNCVANPANAPFKFINNNTDVISINNNGLVTTDNLRGGFNVAVEAVSLNGVTATCWINIEAPVEFQSEGFRFVVIPNADNEVALMGYESNDAVVNIPASVEYNGNVYNVTTIGRWAFSWNGNIVEVVIPTSVTQIREENFNSCSSLKKVTIADSATELQLSNYNFTDNRNLTELYLGRNVTYSDDSYCFRWNGSLSEVVIGAEVTSLPDNVFSENNNLSVVRSLNPVPPVLGENAFGYNNLSIIVPTESVEAYRSAWEQYASNIIDVIDATDISFGIEEATLYNGQSIQLPLTVEPEDATVIWTSSNSNLVSVDRYGNVSYGMWTNETGEATITASTINGLTAECKVIAKHWLTFSEDNVEMTPGSTYQVEVSKPAALADTSITWNSENESVATVDENGLITAVAFGDAEINATVDVPINDWVEQRSYTIKVEVRSEVISVEAVDPVISVWKEDTAPINLVFNPDDEYVNREMTWTVANPEIAEVFTSWDGQYNVRGLEAGTTAITGTTANGKTVEIEVTVKARIQDINFAKETIYLTPGESTTLEFTTVPEVTNQTFRFSSNNDDIASIDENGVITAHDFGRAEIEIWYESPWGEEIWWRRQNVVVGIMPESVRFVGSSDYEGQLNYWTPFNIEYTPDDPNVLRGIDWTLDNPEIADIDSYNSFLGKSFGTTAFRGVAVNGEVLEGTISINGLKILVDGEETGDKEVGLGSEFTLDVEASPANLLEHLRFTTDNPEIATVTEDGVVTAVGYGRTSVSVRSENEGRDYEASISITVKPSEGIAFNTNKLTIGPGNYVYLSIIRAENEGWSEINWTSSDENVVAIEWSNEYEARLAYAGPGKATVTATDSDGNFATCEVTCVANIEDLTFNTDKIYVAPAGTFQLEYTTVPEFTGQTIRFESEDESIATVDPETGLVSGVSYGYTYIQAIPSNGWRTWTVPVEVCNLPESVQLVGSTDYEGNLNDWTRLRIEYTPNDDDVVREIQWTAEDPEITHFTSWDNTYAFYGNKLGSTAFRGVAANGDVLEGTITINGIMIVVDGESADSKDLGLGSEMKLDVEASSGALLQHLTFTSENPEVVTVTEDGVVTAVGYGIATVTVVSSVEVDGIEKQYYDNIQIIVRPSEGIIFNTDKVTISPNGWNYISIIRAGNVEYSHVDWVSSDENVVEIAWSNNDSAELSYRGAGQATVTATDSYGNVASCEVLCIADVEDLTFNTDRIYVEPAGTFQLEYTTVPEMTGQTIRFESENEAVATVDPETGLVTGVDYGFTYIQAIPSNGWRVWSVPVEVCIFPESVRFAGSSDYEGSLNSWRSFDLEFVPDNEDVCKHIEWTAEDPSIVNIDSNDNSFMGLKFGTTAFRGVAVNGDVLEGTITISGLNILVDGEATRWKTVDLGSVFKLDVEASSASLLEHLRFSTDNPEVATVTEDGVVTAVGYGRTYVRAVSQSESGYYEAVISITVKPSEGIAFSRSKITLTPGDYNYISILRADNVDWSDVNWVSSDENVVAITWSNQEEAQLSYVGQGTATVTATDSYGNSASCDVTCIAYIEDLTFNTDKIYVAPAGTFQLEYTTVPEMTGQTIRFESENEAVATVDPETGLVTGVDYGYTYIRAIPSYGWSSWRIPVQVVNMPESVTLVGSTDYEGALSQWTPFQIEFTPNDDDICREIQWTVYNPEIGYFTDWGNTYAFYGNALGTTAFRGVAVNGDVLEGTITIAGIEFVVDGEPIRSKNLNLGEELRLGLRASSDDLLENVTFTSNNTDVVTVTQDGLVTAVGYGDTQVTATASVDGKYYNAYLYATVLPSEGMVIDKQQVTLTPYNAQLIYIVRAANLNLSYITWRSSDEDVVRIDWGYNRGAQISYVGPGTATVTATDEYGNEAVCEVTCLGYIDDVTFNTNKIFVAPGKTFQLEWTIYPEGTGQTIAFESENEWVATVDPETGLVTGLNEGQTYIRAFDRNGKSWYVEVQVRNLPESVKFVGSSDYVGSINQWITLKIEYTPNDYDVFREIQWTVENPEIGYFSYWDNTYHFWGRNIGTTAIRGVAANGDVLEGTITIEGITFVDEEGRPMTSEVVEVGSKTQLEVAASDNLPENTVYIYTSSNTEVATVSEDGVVTAVGPGVATITARVEARQNGRRNIADGRSFIKAVTEVRENEWQNFEAQIQITVLPSEGIVFDNSALTLSPYDSYGYISIIRAKDVAWSSVTWVSSDENVVAFSWAGSYGAQLEYRGPGKATVTATDGYGNVAVCEVTCVGSIESVDFNTDRIYVAPGKTFQLKYTIKPEDAGQTLTFKSGNEAIAKVDPETGLVTGVAYGETYIEAISQVGWSSWSVPVTVCNVPESVKLVGSTNYKGVINGYTPLQIKYTPKDDDVYKDIKWTVEDPEIGYITERVNETTHESEYAIFGTKLGTTAFKGVAANGDVLEGTFTNGLAFDKKEVVLTPGNPEYIKVERFKDINWSDVTWESSDENVVSIIMPTGYQAALNYKGAGEAIVKATDGNGYVAICKVTGTGVLISPAEVAMPTNSTYKLNVKVFPEGAETSSILWRTQDSDLVVVGVDGTMISKGKTGETKVFVTTFVNGYRTEASCDVTVGLPVTGITPAISANVAAVGTEVQLMPTVLPENAANKKLRWKSSDEKIATVDENGLVTIHSEGSVAITAYSVQNPMIFATFYFIGTSFTTPDTSAILAEVGTEVELPAIDIPDINWVSSDENVASVDENGVVSVHAEGPVAIAAYSAENPLNYAAFYVIATDKVGVDGINEGEATFDIYNMNGILVKKNATAEDYELLEHGFYIIKKGNEVIKVKH